MENIHCINENFKTEFDFSQLSLAQPTPVQGGSYFTRIKNNNQSLYLQLPSCKTKQGVVKTEKKIYCDLMFSNDNNYFINWLEKFELQCHKLIYEKRQLWFHNDFDMDDIEAIFTPTMRLYKSGEYILVRVNIPNSKQIKNKPCSVYNEQEVALSLDDIKEKNYVIPLISIEGIRFSSKSFQIDITLPQVMVIDESPDIGSQCVIKLNNPNKIHLEKSKKNSSSDEEDLLSKDEKNNSKDDKEFSKSSEDNEYICNNEVSKDEKELSEEGDKTDKLEDTTDKLEAEIKENEIKSSDLEENLEEDSDNLEKNIIEENNEKPLEEVSLAFNDISESIKLRKPKEVYYEIYKAARNKAKMAKKAAIEAHLEAKNIKIKYMLDEIEDSDEENYDTDSIISSEEENEYPNLG